MIPPAIRLVLFLTAILFTMGSCLLLFFIVLSGAKHDGVLGKWYWLAADTSGTPGANYPVSHWSMYGLCGYEKGKSVTHPGKLIECTKNAPAYPLDPKRNFHSGDDTWDEFQTNKYFYMSRFDFAFYLIALFFEVVTLFTSVLAYSLRSLGIVTGVMQIVSFIFVTIAASLSTAAYNQGKNAFHAHGYEAKLKPALYGFAWAVVFMAIVNTVFFFLAMPSKDGISSRGGRFKSRSKRNSGGTPATKRGGYRFGIGKKRTTQGATTVVDSKDASSFVRA